MAVNVDARSPGTSRTEGWGTSSKVWVGINFTCKSVSMGSTRSPTTTVRYSGASWLTPVKIWSGPARSKTVSPGYRTKAMVFWFCSSVAMQAPLLLWLLRRDRVERRCASAEQFLVEIRPTGEGPLQVRPVLVQRIPEPVPVHLAPVDAPERRLGVILDYDLCALGCGLASQLGHQLQHSVDPTRHSFHGQELAVLHRMALDVIDSQLLK